MILYWSLILALSMLLYVLLDGFDLGVGMLFGMTRDETRRRHMLAAVSPLWDGNETWLIVAGVVLWGAFSQAYSLLVSAFYIPVILMPVQLLFGHLVGDYVHRYQPVKFAAIEARWHDEQPAAEVLIAWPDATHLPATS